MKRRSNWLSLLCATVAAGCFAVAVAPGLASASGDELDGRWVLLQHTATRAEVPVVGDIIATTRVVSLHDLTRKGKKLRGKGTLCSLDLDSGSRMVTTIIPEALKRALPAPLIHARLVGEGDNLKLKQRRRVVVVGAKLKRRERDKMPTSASDARVYDQDGDGHPGVTIRVEGIVDGEMYVAQRSWTQLSGRRTGADSFSGRVFFGNEQHILGATSSMLKDPPKAKPLPNRSFFKLQRVAADASCRDAKRLAAGWKKK